MSTDGGERGSPSWPPLWLALAAALPGLIGAACGVLWLLGAAAGLPAGADSRTLTLSEAMVVASHADVIRLLHSGADPNAPSHVRAGLVGIREHSVTPIEAATASIRTGPIRQLMEAGARIDEQNYPVLWCAATVRRNQDMLRFLASQHPPGPSPLDCSTVRALW